VNGHQRGGGQNNGPRMNSATKKALVNEDKDDLNAYLTQFKTACTAFDVGKNIATRS